MRAYADTATHVGGFVITRGPLIELAVLTNVAMPGRTVLEWDKDDIDALGILKVDVLGLGMLSCLRRGFDLLRRHRLADHDLASLPRDCEHPGGGARRQAGADHLCGAVQRSEVRDEGYGGVVADGMAVRSHPARAADEVCGWWKRDGLTVNRRSGNLLLKMVLDAASLMRTGTRGSPSWPGQCPETGYVGVD